MAHGLLIPALEMSRFLSLSFAILAQGCLMKEPPVPAPPGGGPLDAGSWNDAGQPDAPTDPGPPVLNVQSYQAQTVWDRVPVQGTGPRGGMLLAESDGIAIATAGISSSGDFCIELPLELERTNTFSLKAVDTQGRYTTPVTIEITQSGTPPTSDEPVEDPIIAESRNVLAGAVIDRMSVVDIDGDVYALTDEDPDTSVFFRNAYDTSPDWLILRLNERSSMERVRMISAPDCMAEEFNVLISDIEHPGPAVEGGAGWTLVARATLADVSEDREFTFSPVVGRLLGIQFVSLDCAEWFGQNGQHRIHEIEAWSPEQRRPSRPSGVTAPGCGVTGH